jgi:uncharacterized RDD family membrane protein YckC
MNATDQSDRPNLYAPPQAEVGEIVDTDGEIERAGRGVRLGAFVIDSFIPGLIFLPMLIGLGFDISGIGTSAVTPFTIIGIGIATIGFLAWIGITIYFVHRNGQTIAKRMLGIKVVRSDGSRASLARIFWLRNVVNALPSGFPILGNFYFLVDSLLIFGDKQQCVHDMIADTIVVNA